MLLLFLANHTIQIWTSIKLLVIQFICQSDDDILIELHVYTLYWNELSEHARAKFSSIASAKNFNKQKWKQHWKPFSPASHSFMNCDRYQFIYYVILKLLWPTCAWIHSQWHMRWNTFEKLWITLKIRLILCFLSLASLLGFRHRNERSNVVEFLGASLPWNSFIECCN